LFINSETYIFRHFGARNFFEINTFFFYNDVKCELTKFIIYILTVQFRNLGAKIIRVCIAHLFFQGDALFAFFNMTLNLMCNIMVIVTLKYLSCDTNWVCCVFAFHRCE